MFKLYNKPLKSLNSHLIKIDNKEIGLKKYLNGCKACELASLSINLAIFFNES